MTSAETEGSSESSTCVRLSGLRIGMWRCRKHESLWLVVAPRYLKFVFLVERQQDKTRSSFQGRNVARFRQRSMLEHLGAHSPFSSSYMYEEEESCVFAFEVKYLAIRGVDYNNPLVRAGKLVLDACNVEKREFKNIDMAMKYYEVDHSLTDKACSCHSKSRGEKLQSKTRLNLLDKLDVAFLEEDGGLGARGNRRLHGGEGMGESPAFSFFLSDNDGIEPQSDKGRSCNGEEEENLDRSTPINGKGTDGWGRQDAASFAQNFTSSVQTYSFRSISAEWTDVHLPCALFPVFEKDERLLKMYESGLPTWSVFLPSYGLYYRPWLRTLTWILFYLFSVFSLTVGFWDLYKTLPGLQSMLARVVESLWLPPTAVMQWIEEHAQIRLSILLTYLFGKSEFFMYAMRNVGRMWKSTQSLMAPIAEILTPGAIFLRDSVFLFWGSTILPILSLMRSVIDFIGGFIIPPVNALYSLLAAPVILLCQAIVHAWAAISMVWTACIGTGRSLLLGGTSAFSLLNLGSKTATGANPAMTTGWLLWSVPAEAFRTSLVKVLRASNAVWKFLLHICTGISRHRLTLSRRAARSKQKIQRKLLDIIIQIIWNILDIFMAFHAKLSRLFGDKGYKKDQDDSIHVNASENDESSAEACIASISQDGLRNRRDSLTLDDTAESGLTTS
eukprot:jgi/Picsp_1/3999/NSC_01511-R1_protein